jgi:hypothetical protein
MPIRTVSSWGDTTGDNLPNRSVHERDCDGYANAGRQRKTRSPWDLPGQHFENGGGSVRSWADRCSSDHLGAHKNSGS